MKKIVMVVMCLMAVVNISLADNIRGINIDFVGIGNAGNAGDTRVMTIDGTSGYGAVNYNYRIGKYEITNAQWNTFTAAAGAPTGNDGGYDHSAKYTGAQQPTNAVSWYEVAQFCNYLTSGNKYSGAYKFDISGNFQSIDRVSSISTYGTTYVIPTENEWYKAAYHKNDGVTGNYWLYPTQSNIEPSNDLINPDPGNNANFHGQGIDYTIGYPNYLTSVGEFENSDSAYGTFDQGGNVLEWTETIIHDSIFSIRGGSALGGDNTGFYLASSYRLYYHTGPYAESDEIGFRIASVPEPCSLILLSLGVFILRKQTH